VVPVPKNIYGVTKTAAEDLCALFARKEGVPALVLRTSRFFPEEDDDGAVSARYDVLNHQANELLYRRADIDDLVTAHALAVELAPRIGFDRLIISATTPFGPEHLADLRRDAAGVVRQLFPEAAALYAARGWTLPAEIDRVYVNDRARRVLGWAPVRDFRFALDALSRGEDFRSPLARAVGRKGYHDRPMPPYTTA
jgi:UDP-glucose 4-epimerase